MKNKRPQWTLPGMGPGPRREPITLITVLAFLVGSVIAVVAALLVAWLADGW